MSRHYRWRLFGGVFFAVSFLSRAAENLPMTEPVIVTASRFAESSVNATQSVTVISRDEISANGSRGIGGLLQDHGIQFNDNTPNSAYSSITMRGMKSGEGDGLDRYVLVLVDGRRVGTGNLAMLPMVNIERIEILRGPAAAQYGSSAVGGVINIITKRGAEKFSLSASSGGGSAETYRGEIESGWAKNGFDFSGGLAYLTAGSYRYAGGNLYQNSGLDYRAAYSANLGYTFWDIHRLGAVFQKVQTDNFGSPNVIYNGQSWDQTAYANRNNYSFDFNYAGGADTAGLTWEARYFFGENNYATSDRDPLRASGSDWSHGTSTYYSHTNFQGSQLQTTFAHDWLTFTGGADWYNSVTQNSGVANSATKSDHHNLGLFALAKIALFDERLILTGAARQDFFWLALPGSGKTERSFAHTTPSAGVAFHATEWLTLRANYAQSFRAPTAIETLGWSGGGYNMFYTGDPNLKPENGHSVDFGFAVNRGAFNFETTWFTTYYYDKIDTVNNKYINRSGATNYQGLESSAGFDFGEQFSLPVKIQPYVNLTGMLNYRDADGGRLDNVSALNIGYGVRFAYPKIGFELDLRATYHGEQTQNAFDPVSFAATRETVGGATTLDLSMRQTLRQSEKYGKLSANLEIRNLTDQYIESYKNYPLPGRTYFAGLKYEF